LLRTIIPLFILISLCFSYTSKLNSLENTDTRQEEYLVKSGDTLWSLSRKFNIDVKKIIEFNNILTFQNGAPYIKINQIIRIPNKELIRIKDICYSENTFFGNKFVNKPRSKIVDECLEHLSSVLDETVFSGKIINGKFWNAYLSDERYPYYFYNMILKRQSSINTDNSDLTFTELTFKENQKILNIISYGVLKGDFINKKYVEKYFRSFSKYLDDFPFSSREDLYKKTDPYHYDTQTIDFLNNTRRYSILDNPKPGWDEYKKYKNLDASKLDHDERIRFYEYMLSNSFRAEDIFYKKIRNIILDDVVRNEDFRFPLIGVSYEDNLFNNLVYMEMNGGSIDVALEAVQAWFRATDVKDLDEYHKKFGYLDSLDPTELYMHAYIILNFESALDKKYPEDINKRMLRRTEYLDWVSSRPEMKYFSDVNTSYQSDTALTFISFGECEKSSEYLDKAIVQYKLLYTDTKHSVTDGVEELLQLANCFLDQSNYMSAEKYIDLAEIFLKGLMSLNPTHSSYLKLTRSRLFLLKGDVNNANELYVDAGNFIYDNSSKINAMQLGGYTGNLISIYSDLYISFQSLGLRMGKHPIELINIYENAIRNRSLENIKLDSKKDERTELQLELNKNKENIVIAESLITDSVDSLSFEKIEGLYNERKDIIESILSSNERLNSLLNPSYKEYEKIIKNIDNDSIILSFTLGSANGRAIVSTSEGTFIYKIEKGKNYVDSLIFKLRSSLNNFEYEDYDFESANELYNILIKPLEKYASDKNTIYIYGSELSSLPFSILVKSFNKDTQSHYQKLLDADWLIDDFSFAKIYPLANNNMNTDFDKVFLGVANPLSFSVLGLPDLPESEDEVKYLALASETRGDILFGKNASKEKFKTLANNSYERLVIATHSLPQGWNGISPESSLVFDSNIGDYFLTTSEIVSMDINSDLVLLSSCNSDMAGMDSLYKSFLIAGSNSVVYSNWDLETNSAKVLTEEFFKSMLFDDLSKHSAMRNASIRVKKDYSNPMYAHPAFWGNFSIAYRSL